MGLRTWIRSAPHLLSGAGWRAAAMVACLLGVVPHPARAEEVRSGFIIDPVAVFAHHLYEGAFSQPSGIYFDPVANEVLVADTQNDLIGIFSPTGAPLFSFGSTTLIRAPVKAVADGKGRIFVLDADRTKVKMFNYRGEYLGPLLLPGFRGDVTISAIGMDNAGNLYVGEHSSCQVLVFDSSLKVRTKFGSRGTANGQFTSIAAIAADDRFIYVTDHQAKPVQVFSRRGSFVRSWGYHEMGMENFSLPQGIAVDSAGRLVVIDTLRHEIKFFDVEGTFLGRFGSLGSQVGQVSYPNDVSVDLQGRIYVTDRGNNRVQVYGEKPIPATPTKP